MNILRVLRSRFFGPLTRKLLLPCLGAGAALNACGAAPEPAGAGGRSRSTHALHADAPACTGPWAYARAACHALAPNPACGIAVPATPIVQQRYAPCRLREFGPSGEWIQARHRHVETNLLMEHSRRCAEMRSGRSLHRVHEARGRCEAAWSATARANLGAEARAECVHPSLASCGETELPNTWFALAFDVLIIMPQYNQRVDDSRCPPLGAPMVVGTRPAVMHSCRHANNGPASPEECLGAPEAEFSAPGLTAKALQERLGDGVDGGLTAACTTCDAPDIGLEGGPDIDSIACLDARYAAYVQAPDAADRAPPYDVGALGRQLAERRVAVARAGR